MSWHTWRCFLCRRHGKAADMRKATVGYYAHYMRFHQDRS